MRSNVKANIETFSNSSDDSNTRVNNLPLLLPPPRDAFGEKSALEATRTNTPCGISDFVCCFLLPAAGGKNCERVFPGDAKILMPFFVYLTMKWMNFHVELRLQLIVKLNSHCVTQRNNHERGFATA